jgi:DNA helicase-2/ATP-dependent DNA helicase PcrA
MFQGRHQYNPVSRFIDEIGEEYLDTGLDRKSPVRLKKESITDYSSGHTSGSNRWKPPEKLSSKPYHLEDFRQKPLTSLNYEVGDTVKHIKFGRGVVNNIVKNGNDFEVTVDFERVGHKKMFASFAKLKKL